MFIPECVALAVSDRESGWGCKNLLFMAVGLSVVCILGGLIRSRTNVTCLVGSSNEFGELLVCVPRQNLGRSEWNLGPSFKTGSP